MSIQVQLDKDIAMKMLQMIPKLALQDGQIVVGSDRGMLVVSSDPSTSADVVTYSYTPSNGDYPSSGMENAGDVSKSIGDMAYYLLSTTGGKISHSIENGSRRKSLNIRSLDALLDESLIPTPYKGTATGGNRIQDPFLKSNMIVNEPEPFTESYPDDLLEANSLQDVDAYTTSNFIGGNSGLRGSNATRRSSTLQRVGGSKRVGCGCSANPHLGYSGTYLSNNI